MGTPKPLMEITSTGGDDNWLVSFELRRRKSPEGFL
jgi:hypothetical protein